MGIQGLLPFLDKVSTRVNIAEFKGHTVAVDSYCWLHKGAYTCADKLARGEECDAYIYYCMKYVNMLLSHNIKPILVFDGRYLPAKAGTEKKRRESREANRKIANELMTTGRIDEARNYLRRCIDVTHTMALALIKECRKNNVDCIVAPYEADAQLAYLNLQNIAQFVITEDSDLILFGCSKVVFKLDLQGYGVLVERDRLHLSMRIRPENFSFDSFRYMCILSGCDYLPSLPGIGLGKALKFINKTRDPDIHRALQRIPAYLNMTQLRVTEEYRDSFVRADATFRYQPVFDPRTRSVVPLTDPPNKEMPEVVEKELPPPVAFDLALGNLDPFTLRRVDNFNPDCPQQGILALRKRAWNPSVSSTHRSIWSRDFDGFQPPSEDDKFPGTMNKVAILDVTPLRPPKRLIETEEEKIPSPTELIAMYGEEKQSAPRVKRPCSTHKITSDEHVGKSEIGSISPLKEVSNNPPSPILTQKRALNPFAKIKSANLTDVGPVSVVGRPNLFGALRKFDGYNPVNTDSRNIIVSRTKEENGDTFIHPSEEQNEVLLSVSNSNDLHHIKKDTLEEVSEIAGYSNKENFYHSLNKKKKSVLEIVEEMENNVSSCVLSKEPALKEEVQEVVCEDAKADLEEGMNEQNSFKNGSAFNWSQFVSHKMQSSPKLSSSQAAKKTFKNPFRKKISTVGSKSGAENSGSFCKFSKKTHEIEETIDSPDDSVENSSHELDKSMDDIFRSQDPKCSSAFGGKEQTVSPASSHLSEGVFLDTSGVQDLSEIVNENTLETEDATKADNEFHQDVCLIEKEMKIDLARSFCQLSNSNTIKESDYTERFTVDNNYVRAKQDTGLSEDIMGQQSKQQCTEEQEDEITELFRGSPGSGCLSLPEKKFVQSLVTPGRLVASQGGKRRGTSTTRRFGLGRSSAPSATSQKQNLLAQYGFSKKRKLTD